MRRCATVLAVAAGCLVIGGSLTAREASEQPAGMSTKEKVGYAVGYDLGLLTLEQIRADGVVVDMESFLRGISDAMLERDARMSGSEIYATLADLEREVNDRLAQARLAEDPSYKLVHDENLRRSREFHETFGAKEGVVTLDSGVQYMVVESGSGGERPTLDDTIEVTFQGRTLAGRDIGEAGTVRVAVETMLPGGREVAQMMRPGDTWLIAIPPSMAHGAAGKAPEIGPSETLVFEATLERVIEE